MNAPCQRLVRSAFVQLDDAVAVSVKARIKYTAKPKPAHAPLIAYFVERLPLRNGAPRLVEMQANLLVEDDAAEPSALPHPGCVQRAAEHHRRPADTGRGERLGDRRQVHARSASPPIRASIFSPNAANCSGLSSGPLATPNSLSSAITPALSLPTACLIFSGRPDFS